MDFEYTASQKQWRQEVRAYLAEHVTPELREELFASGGGDGESAAGPLYLAFIQRVRDKGWWGMNWPKEHGGLGLGAIEQQILLWEFSFAGVPSPDLGVTSAAPTIMHHGTEQNKREWLPGLASGEILAVLGYSEPDAGTDLASLRTRAVRDGDEWVINGQKIWNSRAHYATHEFLLVRTDPDVPKHAGLSIIMVPLDSPGIEVRPIVVWSGMRTNEAFFTDVRVPYGNLIGEENKGWSYTTGALNLERGVITNESGLRKTLDQLIAWCTQVGPDGERAADRPEVRRQLAQFEADLEVARLFSVEGAYQIQVGIPPTLTVSENKVFAAELGHRMASYAIELLGPYGLLTKEDEDAPMRGAFEQRYRAAPLLRFAAGGVDVMKDVIAQRGVGMPSYGRTAPPKPSTTRQPA